VRNIKTSGGLTAIKSRMSLQAGSQLRDAVAEARDSSGTQRKGNIRHWKQHSEDVTGDISICNSEM
jgi:hypothetical protein